MNKYHVRFSQFARDKTYGQYWTQIYGALYLHTILYDKMDTGTYIEEVWEKMGTADSHGCVRLTGAGRQVDVVQHRAGNGVRDPRGRPER